MSDDMNQANSNMQGEQNNGGHRQQMAQAQDQVDQGSANMGGGDLAGSAAGATSGVALNSGSESNMEQEQPGYGSTGQTGYGDASGGMGGSTGGQSGEQSGSQPDGGDSAIGGDWPTGQQAGQTMDEEDDEDAEDMGDGASASSAAGSAI